MILKEKKKLMSLKKRRYKLTVMLKMQYIKLSTASELGAQTTCIAFNIRNTFERSVLSKNEMYR
jgi:hypothetical protein